MARLNRPETSDSPLADFVGRRNDRREHEESTDRDNSSQPGHLRSRCRNRKDRRGNGKLKDWDYP